VSARASALMLSLAACTARAGDWDGSGATSDTDIGSSDGDSVGADDGNPDPGNVSLATTTTTTPGGPDDTTTTTSTTSSGSEDTGGPLWPPDSATARYRLTVVNTWSEKTHPGAVPDLAHFSWFGGATHDHTLRLWSLGALASPGMTLMAEIGPTDILLDEVQLAIDAGHADAPLSWQHWFCPPLTGASECGERVVEFDIAIAYPEVTLVSMVGPSPDLFVGVLGLPLFVDGAWLDTQVIDIRPFDAGTRSDWDYTMNGALQDPPLPITRIDSPDDHMIGPGTLGTMTFERVK
jgi:hypothetical protein